MTERSDNFQHHTPHKVFMPYEVLNPQYHKPFDCLHPYQVLFSLTHRKISEQYVIPQILLYIIFNFWKN